jgi:hypothetical protein
MRRLRPWFRDQLIEHLAPTEFRFTSRGLFELRSPETYCYLEFAPGKYPTPESIVDVNGYLGITCLTLNAVFPMPLPPATLDEWEVHWTRGAGYINDETKGPHEWTIDNDDDASIEEFVHDLDNRIVPAMLKRTTDEALLVDWTAGRDWLLAPARQAAYVAVLSAKRGDWATFRTAIETMENESVSAEVERVRVQAGKDLDAVRGFGAAASRAADERSRDV